MLDSIITMPFYSTNGNFWIGQISRYLLHVTQTEWRLYNNWHFYQQSIVRNGPNSKITIHGIQLQQNIPFINELLSLYSINGVNGHIALKIVVLAKQQGRAHAQQMQQILVRLLKVARMRKYVFLKQNHARFKNVSLVQTLKIIVIITLIPYAKMYF